MYLLENIIELKLVKCKSLNKHMPLKALAQKFVELKQINVNNKEKYYTFDAVLSSLSSLHYL